MGRGKVETSAVKVDRMNEVRLVPERACRVLDPLSLRVDRLAGRVGDAVSDKRQYVVEVVPESSVLPEAWV